MTLLRFHLLFLVFLHAIVILSHPVKAKDEEEKLLQGINSYRTSLKLPALGENDKAECLADELADQLGKQPCTGSAKIVPRTETQFSNYPDLLAHCHLNINSTRDGIILPACVPNLDESLVLSSYTESQYAGYVNRSKYTGAGIGSEGNWIVVILTTDSPGGSFVSAASLVGISCHFLSLFLGCFWLLLLVSS